MELEQLIGQIMTFNCAEIETGQPLQADAKIIHVGALYVFFEFITGMDDGRRFHLPRAKFHLTETSQGAQWAYVP